MDQRVESPLLGGPSPPVPTVPDVHAREDYWLGGGFLTSRQQEEEHVSGRGAKQHSLEVRQKRLPSLMVPDLAEKQQAGSC